MLPFLSISRVQRKRHLNRQCQKAFNIQQALLAFPFSTSNIPSSASRNDSSKQSQLFLRCKSHSKTYLYQRNLSTQSLKSESALLLKELKNRFKSNANQTVDTTQSQSKEVKLPNDSKSYSFYQPTNLTLAQRRERLSKHKQSRDGYASSAQARKILCNAIENITNLNQSVTGENAKILVNQLMLHAPLTKREHEAIIMITLSMNKNLLSITHHIDELVKLGSLDKAFGGALSQKLIKLGDSTVLNHLKRALNK